MCLTEHEYHIAGLQKMFSYSELRAGNAAIPCFELKTKKL